MPTASIFRRLCLVASFLSLTSLVPLVLSAQVQVSNDDGRSQLKATRTISFTTDEGTWMSLDVSADGRTILFDMLGDLYTMPIAGGTATQLTRGLAFDRTPRYSPDGKSIAFVSDRAGVENIWLVNADGSGARRLSQEKESFRIGAPTWTPSGDAIVTAHQKRGGEPRRYWRTETSTGARVVLETRDLIRGEISEVLEGAVICKEGFLHFTELRWDPVQDQSEYKMNREFVPTMKSVRAVPRGTDTSLIERPSDAVRGGVRPVLSPDGQWIAYPAMRGRMWSPNTLRATELRIRRHTHPAAPGDTGRLLTFPVETVFGGMFLDDGFARFSFPGFAFTPDGRAIIVGAGGKIKRVDVATGATSDVPFSVNVKADLAPLLDAKVRLDDGPVRLQNPQAPSVSNDGSLVTFSAGGKVWISEPGRDPRRLTDSRFDDGVLEYCPVISPDARSVVFASWSSVQGGRVWRMPVAGGTPTRLNIDSTLAAGGVRWTPDGKRLVFYLDDMRDYMSGRDTARDMWTARLAWMPSEGGATHWLAVATIKSGGSRSVPAYDNMPSLTVSADGQRVYFMQTGVLRSVAFDARDTSEVLSYARLGRGADRLVPSPDGRWLVTPGRGGIALVRFSDFKARRGKADSLPVISWNDSTNVQRIQMRADQGVPQWSSDGRTLAWTIGERIQLLDVSKVDDNAVAATARERVVRPKVPRRAATGTLVLAGARIIPVAGAPIERGDILIRDRRIVAVGPAGSVRRPSGATVLDVSGATIIPGLMDMHVHPRSRGLSFPHYPFWSASLAFGVTTMRVPGWANDDLAQMTETGMLVGPRLIVGYGVAAEDPSRGIDIARAKGQAGVLKNYDIVSRGGDQAVSVAARAAGVRITGHWRENVVFDGFSGWEHSTWLLPMHRDWVQLIARSGTTYSPTTTVHGLHVEWHGYDSVVTRRQQRMVFSRGTRWKAGWGGTTAQIYTVRDLSAVARDILRAGGNVAAATDDVFGNAAQALHAELLMLAAGGMTPAEVLRTATLNGARALGMERDLGSIEAGKIADLVVLHSNPLDDLRNASDVRYVVKDGVVYAGETLDEVWPVARPFRKEPWMK